MKNRRLLCAVLMTAIVATGCTTTTARPEESKSLQEATTESDRAELTKETETEQTEELAEASEPMYNEEFVSDEHTNEQSEAFAKKKENLSLVYDDFPRDCKITVRESYHLMINHAFCDGRSYSYEDFLREICADQDWISEDDTVTVSHGAMEHLESATDYIRLQILEKNLILVLQKTQEEYICQACLRVDDFWIEDSIYDQTTYDSENRDTERNFVEEIYSLFNSETGGPYETVFHDTVTIRGTEYLLLNVAIDCYNTTAILHKTARGYEVTDRYFNSYRNSCTMNGEGILCEFFSYYSTARLSEYYIDYDGRKKKIYDCKKESNYGLLFDDFDLPDSLKDIADIPGDEDPYNLTRYVFDENIYFTSNTEKQNDYSEAFMELIEYTEQHGAHWVSEEEIKEMIRNKKIALGFSGEAFDQEYYTTNSFLIK